MILTNYHRLATIVQSLKLDFRENMEEYNYTEHVDDVKIQSEELDKMKIISELEYINNSGSDREKGRSRKMSDENSKHTPQEITQCETEFSKYISNFCTIYLDFDSHSEEYFSYVVNIN
jgi:hypothetical protein